MSVLDDLSPKRVPYFYKIFKDNMIQIAESESEITIADQVAAEGLGALLDFLCCTIIRG
jgi:hypothetical protein